MPQLNWSILAPIVLALAALAAGIVFFMSVVSAGPQRQSLPPSNSTTRVTLGAPAHAVTTGVQLQGRVIGTPYLQASPSSTAAVVADLHADETLTLSACSDACAWYQVTTADGATSGWVPSAFVSVQGNDRSLPVVH